jgi:hypothetical protein
LSQQVDSYETQQEGRVIKGDLDPILFNSVASTITIWRTLRLLRWMQNFHESTWENEILYVDVSPKDEQFLTRPFLWKIKNTNLESG